MKRYTTIDILRAVAIINMVAYHALWDLVYIYRLPLDWFRSDGATAWQLSIRWAFILLSGFCFSMGRKKLKRGLMVFGCSWVITAVTALLMPDSLILFGVLCFLGFAMLVTIPLDKLFRRIPPALGLAGCGLLFWFFDAFSFPQWLYANYFTAFWGFPHSGFFTTDYVPVFPWIFGFWMGYFLYQLLKKQALLPYLAKVKCRPLEWVGRHSLAIYMVHQPLIYGVLYLIFEVVL
ncbi:MAG: DUF1624 domain-containing protein [Clostridia bacterium]|nr:DUF1624 domain-containing protein [Clostridia bacterium]